MNIVLTMAGKYSRFKLFANQVPKYLLPLGKNTILWHVINELRCAAPELKFYLVANKEDRDFFPILESTINDFSIDTENLIYIGDTESQLKTALTIGENPLVKKIELMSPIVFANIDTIVKGRGNFFKQMQSLNPDEMVIDLFPGYSNEYSYATTDDNNKIENLSDGIRISHQACSGLYGFGSAAFFVKEADALIAGNPKVNFTKLYQRLIDMKYASYACFNDDIGNTVVLGTPEEYTVNLHRF